VTPTLSFALRSRLTLPAELFVHAALSSMSIDALVGAVVSEGAAVTRSVKVAPFSLKSVEVKPLFVMSATLMV
jgi:hypothetical protein